MAEENQTQTPPLQVQDLVIALEAIQLASSRGAFKIEEFTAVGQAYKNLYDFFIVFVIMAGIASVILFGLANGPLKRMMHGIR